MTNLKGLVLFALIFAKFINLGGQNTVYQTNSGIPGSGNSLFGLSSASNLFLSGSTGMSNSVFGISAGNGLTNGSLNSIFGYYAGFQGDGDSNVYIGAFSGYYTLYPENVFIGYKAGYSNTTGAANTFSGFKSGLNNITGFANTFQGANSGFMNTTGIANTFVGSTSGASNTTGQYNTFVGNQSGQSTITGSENSFFGMLCGANNTTGSENSFFGTNAGVNNETGARNSFFGYQSGRSSGIGSNNNSFFGYEAGLNNAGNNNAIFGSYAGINSSGDESAIFGSNAGYSNNVSNTVLFGFEAGYSNSGTNNSFLGYKSGRQNTIGANNTFLGFKSGYYNLTGTNNSFIGNLSGESNLTGNYNLFNGDESGQNNTGGNENVYLGYLSGNNQINGNSNVMVGSRAGNNSNSGNGSGNTLLGYLSGQLIEGNDNTFLGARSGNQFLTGDNNIFIGNFSGLNNTTGNRNVFIGYQADGVNALNNAVAIGPNAYVSQSDAIVLGEVNENVKVGIGVTAPSNKLHVVASMNPLRLEGLASSTENDILVTDANGVVSKRNISTIQLVDDDWRWNGLVEDINNSIYRIGPVTIGSNVNNLNSSEGLFVRKNINISDDTRFTIGHLNALSFLPGGQSLSIGRPIAFQISDSICNVMIGHGAGYKLRGASNPADYSSDNVLIGIRAGHDIISTNELKNVMVGNYSGDKARGKYNTFIGMESGYGLLGDRNIAIGIQSRTGSYNSQNTSENDNISIGAFSGQNSYGEDCIYIGTGAGQNSRKTYNGTYYPKAIENIFIGASSGLNNIGEYNVFMGLNVGRENTGSNNVVIGQNAYNQTGTPLNSYSCVIIGAEAGLKNNTSDNVFVGAQSGNNNSTGNYNTFIGRSSGLGNTTGVSNTFLGYVAGGICTSGEKNVVVGANAGLRVQTGKKNVIIGQFAGNTNLNLASEGVTLLGYGTDAATTAISNAAAIGTDAYVDEDNVIVLGKTTTSTRVCIGYNGVTSSTLGSGTEMLFVNGDAVALGSWLPSDINYKENIEDVKFSLNKFLELHPVQYNFKSDSLQRFPKELQYGFLAQEISELFPNLVRVSSAGKSTMNYVGLIPVLTKAIQSGIEDSKKNEESIYMLQQKLDSMSRILNGLMEGNNSINKSTSISRLPNVDTLVINPLAWINQNIPNPANDETIIEYFVPDVMSNGSIVFLNESGAKITQYQINHSGFGKIVVDHSSLASGNYYYSLYVNGKKIDTKTLVVLH